MGTSNNCRRSSGAPNLPANDSALFSFRFCAVHPKEVRDCHLRLFFEVPLRLFDDGNTMPRTWAEWHKIAGEMEQGLKAYGHPVMRVRIDPASFAAWCAAHGTTPGRQGRKMFVAAAVNERYGDQT